MLRYLPHVLGKEEASHSQAERWLMSIKIFLLRYTCGSWLVDILDDAKLCQHVEHCLYHLHR
jgi:hypothetical protein